MVESWQEKAEKNLELYGTFSPTWKDRPLWTLVKILANALWIIPVLLIFVLWLGETFNIRLP